MAKRYWMCVVALCLSAGAVLSYGNSKITRIRRDSPRARDGASQIRPALTGPNRHVSARALSIPLTFEPTPRGARNAPQFVGRGMNMDVALTTDGIELAARGAADRHTAVAVVHFILPGKQVHHGSLRWRGVERLRGQTNYLLGNDPARWRTHVPHYARVEAKDGSIGIAAYARGQAVEYDLRVAPGVDASQLRLAVTGARHLYLDGRGNLVASVGATEFVMNKPTLHEEAGSLTNAAYRDDPAAEEAAAFSNSRYRRTRSTRLSTRSGTRSSRRGYSHRTRSGRSRSSSSRGRTRRSTRPRSSRSSGRRRSRRASGRRRSTRRRVRSTANVQRFPATDPSVRRAHMTMSVTAKRTVKRVLDASYVLEQDGTIGFRVNGRDPRATLVIDPTITLAYSSFLGGAGADAANSIATDSSGNVYIAGTTTSATTFPETSTAQLGPGLPVSAGSTATAHEFFIAKIEPAQTGATSLVYLTFLGGSTDQAGGLIAVESAGDVAITGTTSSADFPVTDGSTRTAGANDTIVSEIDPAGAKLLYSTMFGGGGAESRQTNGGIALDASGDILVASDTNSTDLPVTAGSYASVYTSPSSDGFLAIFHPGATPALKYCSYLGLNGQIGVGGVAVDASGNAYIAGFTSDSLMDFPFKNAAQASFGGGSFDAFVMKIAPVGNGVTDLKYATLLGGSNSDQAFAIAVDSANPPNAYVTGTTSSANFPTNGTTAAYQPALPSNATSATSDSFVSVIAQNATTGKTSLAYSTYLGGSQADTGYGIEAAQAYAVYVTGTANSWDFPWRDNFQPFNGYGNAFVVKLDTTTPGASGLIYSTPLGGTSPAGAKAGTQGTGIAVDESGNVWVTGQTASLDFASAGSPGNGFQQICASCQESPLMADAFVAEIQENTTQQLPSLYFSGPSIPLNFGTQAIGATNVPSQFAAIKNGGETTLNITSVTMTGLNSADFSLSSWSGCVSSGIAPGAICSFEVGFIPTVVGPEQGFVQVVSDAPGSPQVLEVFGTGDGPLGVLTPTSLTFGNVPKGGEAALSARLTDTGTEPLSISSVRLSGPDAAQFVLTGDNSCSNGPVILAAGQSCVVTVSLEPQTLGTFQAEVDIEDDSGGKGAVVQTVPLSGVGASGAAIATFSPASVQFVPTIVGSTSVTQTVTLTNTGDVAMNLTSVSLSGTNASEFVLVGGATSSCLGITTIDPGATNACTVGVQFTPQTSGDKTATLTFRDDAEGSPQTVPLTGTAESPAAIQLHPASLGFAPQAVGTKSAPQSITIASTGQTALGVNGISVTGPNASDFSEMNNCPPTLAANGNCSTSIVFQPTAPGARTASLTVADNAAGSPQQVPLTGSATQAGMTLSSGSVNFGNQVAGTMSAAVSVTVTNSGNGPLVISGFSFSGANASDFSQTNTCTGSARANGIPAGGTCAVQITFKPVCGPVASASRSATLSLVDNAPGSPQAIALTGTGTGSLCFIVPSGDSTSASVSPGQTGSYALQVEAANNFTGSVTLACAGAPANSTCTVAPTSANIGENQIAALKVSVATSAGNAASLAPRPQVPSEFLPLGMVFLVMVTVLIGLLRIGRADCAGGIGAAHRLVFLRDVALACATLLLVIVVAGCGAGGNSSSSSSDPPTPAGTYTITITGSTSGGASQSIALTLTVE